MGSNPHAPKQLFLLEKEMFRFVVLPCFDLGLTVPIEISNNTETYCRVCFEAHWVIN